MHGNKRDSCSCEGPCTCRYEWMHGITAIPREQMLEQTGELWPRISITLRKLI